jgi:hypothetical protein
MKGIVYDIYCIRGSSIKNAVKEYVMLLKEIKALASQLVGNYRIRLDVGTYEFSPKGCVQKKDELRIHLLLEGKDTTAIENALGANIASFPLFHNFEKRVFGQRIFNRHNKKVLDKMSNHHMMIKCKYDRQNQAQSVMCFPIRPLLT